MTLLAIVSPRVGRADSLDSGNPVAAQTVRSHPRCMRDLRRRTFIGAGTAERRWQADKRRFNEVPRLQIPGVLFDMALSAIGKELMGHL